MYVETTRQPYMAEYFLKAVQEKGYRIQDSNAEQVEGILHEHRFAHDRLLLKSYSNLWL